MTEIVENKAGLSTDHSKAVQDQGHSHGGAQKVQGSRADRLSSFDPKDIAVPHGREEEWRFSPVAKLAPLFAEDLGQTGVEISANLIEGHTLEDVDRNDERLGKAGKPGDRTAVAAWASFQTAKVLTVNGTTSDDAASWVTLNGVDDRASVSHLVIDAKPLSEGVIVLEHTGLATVNQTVEINVADGANLTVVSVQNWSDGSVHAGSHRIVLGRDAKVKHVVVTFGGDVVRITPDAVFSAPGGEVNLLGLYFTNENQHQEHRLFVDHAVEKCLSRVTYKGALQGKGAHAVWVGDVLIRANAEGTDTYELNRNLVLTKDARADSVPNLEIETGLIEGAGHASATGRFDDEQLFYLQSRGISQAEARRLVVHGFFADLIHEIGIAAVETKLLADIELQLSRSAEAITTGVTS